MAFSLVPLLAFVDGATKLTASTLNYWRTAIASAIDAVGGSGGAPYTPVTAIEVEGAGLYADPLWGWVRSGKTLGIDTGGHLLIYGDGTVEPDGLFYVDGTSGHPGEIQIKNHGNLHALSGSSTVWESGSTWKLATPIWNGTSGALIAYGGGIKVGDTTLGVGKILLDGSGAASGSATNLTVQGGAWAQIDGSGTRLQVTNGGLLLVDASTVTLQAGSTITVPSVVNFASQHAATADPGANVAAAMSQVRAFAVITLDGSGGATLVDGHNITSVDANGLINLEVTFARDFAGTNYGMTIGTDSGFAWVGPGPATQSGGQVQLARGLSTAGVAHVALSWADGTTCNANDCVGTLTLNFTGRQ